ncbi:MAG: sulfatase [Acidobacteriia bacterium]|nr:sulfatase [Terriglobia bacterium]
MTIPKLLLALAMSLSAAMQAAAASPDILLIAVDDLNDWVGPLGGHPQASTPNIDRLARRGMTFANAHVTAPLCNPSRASLMSGMLTSSFGVYLNRQDWRKAPALQGNPVLPLFLQRNGYRTLGGGKLFHAATVNPLQFYGLLPKEGFDDYYPAPNRQLPDEIRPLGRPVNKNPGFISGFFDWAPVAAEDSAMGDGQVVAWASRQLRANRDKPLFLGVGIYRPHIPWYVPQRYFDMHPIDRIELPATLPNDLDDVPGSVRYASNQRVHKWILDSGNWERGVQAYLASISFADAMVGRLLDALDTSGRAENTVVVLFSDHGYHLGEKSQWRKYTLWEDSTHVPLIVVAPGITTPGVRSSAPVSTLDLYPTIADLAGLALPRHLEGHSLRPLLESADADWPHHAITTYRFGNHSVRTRHHRYIRYENGDEELYDHRVDPHEWHNLASLPEHADLKARLRSLLPSVNVESIRFDWR